VKSDRNGVSTCPAGQESYEEFKHHGHTHVQYDYRNHDGELFSCVAKTLEEARGRRDGWLAEKHRKRVDRIVCDAIAEGDLLPPPREGSVY